MRTVCIHSCVEAFEHKDLCEESRENGSEANCGRSVGGEKSEGVEKDDISESFDSIG